MRILTLTNLYPNPLQPHRATFNRQQIRALSTDHEAQVIAPITWTDELFCRLKGKPKLPPKRRTTFDGIEVTYPRVWFVPKCLRGIYGHCYMHSVAAEVERVGKKFRPDVLFAPWAYPDGWAAARLGQRLGIPVVVKVHGSDILTLHDFPSRRQRTIESVCQADAVIAVSRDLAENVVKLGADPDRVHVVYDGIDTAEFEPGSKVIARQRLGMAQNIPVVLFVGNLVAVKGVDTLVAALANLRDKGTRVQAYIVGDGPLRNSLERLVHKNRLAARMHFMGPLPHAQLPDWYRAADVFVLPSHSEGVPCVLLEAMACRTPFVASRVGGIPEIADLGVSRLTEAGNVVTVAEAIGHFVARPDSAARFDWPSTRTQAEAALDLAQVFERVVANYRTRSNLATVGELVADA